MYVELYLYTDIPTAIVYVTSDSITLNWVEPPPALTGNLQRAITQYAVTVVSEDDTPLYPVFIPAEAGIGFTFYNLEPGTAYDIHISAVIDTENQGEVTFDIGEPSLSSTTCKEYWYKLMGLKTVS